MLLRRLLKEKRIPIGTLLLEGFLIVAAVLAALGVDEWREARDRTRTQTAVSRTLVLELKRNVAFLTIRWEYHEKVLQALGQAAEEHFVGWHTRPQRADPRRPLGRSDIGLQDEFGLMLAPGLSSSAWQAALTSGALATLAYDTQYHLASAYTALDELDQTATRIVDDLEAFDRAFLLDRGYVVAFNDFYSTFHDLVLREREVQETAGEAIQQLEPTAQAE